MMNKDNNGVCKLPMNGAYNMRDLGGYANAFGKTVKYGKLFRSDDLTALTSEDLDYLSRLPLRMVIDFRSKQETTSSIDRLPQTVSKRIELPIAAGDISTLNFTNVASPEEFMKSMYANVIRNYQPMLVSFFELLLDKKETPLLFHCTAGKDRTGIAAALFLSAMMVDREMIMKDYMLSAEFLKDKYAAIVKRYPELEVMLTVKEEYLLEAFKVIDEEYEGIENYLVNHLNVDCANLRLLYTE